MTTGLISSKKFSLRNFAPVEEEAIEKPLTFELYFKVFMIQTFREAVFKQESTRSSKRFFFVISGLFSVMMFTMSIVTSREKNISSNMSQLNFVQKNQDSQESDFLCFLISVDIQSHLSHFFQKSMNWQPHSFRGGIDWETNNIDPRIEIMLIQVIQNFVTKTDSSLLSKGCFSVATGFYFL